MRRALVVVAAVLVLPSNASADPPKPIAKWEVRVAPIDSSNGFLAYAVAPLGWTSIPVPGSTWTCRAAAPTQAADAAGRKETVTLLCMTATQQTIGILTECRPGTTVGAQQFSLGGPPGGQSYVVGLVCTPLPPAATVAPRPTDKSF